MKTEMLYDMIIVGGGPAGLSAAIYMARAKYRVLVVEKDKTGGQIRITSELVNYPGVEKSGGVELTDHMKRQAEGFGAEFITAEVLDMDLEEDVKKVQTTGGTFEALGIVLAVGANPRKSGFGGEKEFQGRGVAYCATCDGEFFTGMDVFVIGGGFAAVEESIFLTKYAKHITILVRGKEFSCAKTVSGQLLRMDKISVEFQTELVCVEGNGMLERAVIRNRATGEKRVHEAKEKGAFGVFVFAGYVPNTGWLPKQIELNEQGYIMTDRNQKTNLDGVYAAGDVCVKNLRQVVTAVSDGAVAATSMEKYVSVLHEKLGLPELITKAVKGADKAARVSREKEQASEIPEPDRGFFDKDIRVQLGRVFPGFSRPVLLKAWLDEGSLSGEIKGFLGELATLTDRVFWERGEGRAPEIVPSIELCSADGSSSGIQFHGVPGGHEINSFIVALYNVAGPGKEMDAAAERRIESIAKKTNIKVLVSLSCTMCPETVMAAQKIAAVSGMVEAEMIDLMHFPEWKERFQVMSVPCMIVNDEQVSFGKKGIGEVLDAIGV